MSSLVLLYLFITCVSHPEDSESWLSFCIDLCCVFFSGPFALLALGTIPVMSFGAEAEMQMYMGDDEGDIIQVEDIDKTSAAGIVVESLLNIRTVASLTLEKRRSREFVEALHREDPTPFRTNAIKGSTSGAGQLIQMVRNLLMFLGTFDSKANLI